MDKVEEDIKRAKALYEYVFVLPHWGNEYTPYPNQEQIKMANRMIEAGVDGVIGTHTHQIQPLINIRNKPVFYSLGNFLFPDFYMKPPRPIWYPDENDDTENIKITNDYPFPIDTEMLRVWKSSARKGIIATVNVRNSKVISSFNTIRLTDSNFIIFHKENILNMLHLKMIGFLSTNKNLFLLRYYRAIMIRIKIVISKLRNLKQ
jgi:poly-gamma-glutamate synthesis protein (capsule biosynthesis protein)